MQIRFTQYRTIYGSGHARLPKCLYVRCEYVQGPFMRTIVAILYIMEFITIDKLPYVPYSLEFHGKLFLVEYTGTYLTTSVSVIMIVSKVVHIADSV